MGATEVRILLVEDDRFLRKAAEATLRHYGYVVLTAPDGEEALGVARHVRPDLILLDLIMPKMQGFEVLRALKADPETAGIPVLVLSNLSQDRDAEEALASGAAGYYVKSDMSLRDLVEHVRAALPDKRPTAGAPLPPGGWGGGAGGVAGGRE